MGPWWHAGRAVVELYPRGLMLFWLAPAILALVVIPELAQHVVEIQLGMFESRDSFAALSNDPTRMGFGYVKIAGLVLALFASARFWWIREHGGRWWNFGELAWGRLLVGLLLFLGIPAIPELFRADIPEALYPVLAWGFSLVMLPMLFLVLAGLFGDRRPTILDFWVRAWPWLLLTAILVVLAFAPAQWLHQMNHRWALGAEPTIVWALMIFDSLVVGLLAGLPGTALYLGYAAFASIQRQLQPIGA